MSKPDPSDGDSAGAVRRAVLVTPAVATAASGLLAWIAYSPSVAAHFWLAASVVAVAASLAVRRAGGDPGVGGLLVLPSGRLGAATRLTLLRGVLISVLGGFLLAPSPGPGMVSWVPGLLYTAAAIGDRYDGILARRRGQVTELGRRLDVKMDALGLLVAPLVAVHWGRLPVWYLLLGGAYYLFGVGLWLRRKMGWLVFAERLRPNRAARFFAGVQMTVCAAALLPVFTALPWSFTSVAATAAMTPTLILFARDWLVAVGWRPGIPERPAPTAPPLARYRGRGDAAAPPPPS